MGNSDKLNEKYKLIDGKNELKGVRFYNLIDRTNEIIDDVNTEKENTIKTLKKKV